MPVRTTETWFWLETQTASTTGPTADIRETKESNVPSDPVREELLRRAAEKLLALV